MTIFRNFWVQLVSGALLGIGIGAALICLALELS